MTKVVEGRKAQILEAARVLFTRNGYSKTSVDEIASSLGMAKSALYYYYKNKEHLFFDSFSSEWENNINKFKQKAALEDDPYRRIITFNLETLKYYESVVLQHKIPVKILIETRNMFRDFVYKLIDKHINFLSENLDEGIASGQFMHCDTRMVATTILEVKYAMQYDHLSKFMHKIPTKNDFHQIEESVIFAIELMLKGLLKR